MTEAIAISSLQTLICHQMFQFHLKDMGKTGSVELTSKLLDNWYIGELVTLDSSTIMFTLEKKSAVIWFGNKID